VGLAFGHHEDRTPTHGYEATREAAMAAFAKSWRRMPGLLSAQARCGFSYLCRKSLVLNALSRCGGGGHRSGGKLSVFAQFVTAITGSG
jgi:hypothetical protein